MSTEREKATQRDHSEYEITDSSEFPSLSIALEEIRRHYDTEQTRKSQLESKISAVIAINALLISLVGVLGQNRIITTVFVLLPALLSAGFGLHALSAREYRKPGPVPDEMFGYARQDRPNSQKKFIQNYRQAIKHNVVQNDERTETLEKCVQLTAISFVLIVFAPLIDIGVGWFLVGLQWLIVYVSSQIGTIWV